MFVNAAASGSVVMMMMMMMMMRPMPAKVANRGSEGYCHTSCHEWTANGRHAGVVVTSLDMQIDHATIIVILLHAVHVADHSRLSNNNVYTLCDT
jgi:hypothetical protein